MVFKVLRKNTCLHLSQEAYSESVRRKLEETVWLLLSIFPKIYFLKESLAWLEVAKQTNSRIRFRAFRAATCYVAIESSDRYATAKPVCCRTFGCRNPSTIFSHWVSVAQSPHLHRDC